jgi:acyl transferase domain-containing protein
VKTNIGHLEAAAGVAGLLKVAMALWHRTIPPSLHFQKPNPLIPFDDLRLAVPTKLRPWPEPSNRAIAGISSFGFGGTNCHVVVEGFSDQAPTVLEVSRDLRSHEKLAFIFSGNGSQWLGMGRGLLSEPVFRTKVQQCDQAFRKWTDWSLLEVLVADAGGRLQEVAVLQPALFAIQVSLAAQWESWGIQPDEVVVGGLGEVAAAHVAGILTLEDAARVVFHRSRLLQRKAGMGTVAVLNLPFEEACALLNDWLSDGGISVCIAGANSPSSTLVSGDTDALQRFLASASEQGVVSHRVNMDFAGHSPKFDDVQGELAECIEGIDAHAGTISMVSTVTGSFVPGGECTAAYWVRNLR